MTDQSIGDAVWLEILHRAVNDQTYFETKVSVAWRDDVNQVASKNEQENERTRSDSQNLDAGALLLSVRMLLYYKGGKTQYHNPIICASYLINRVCANYNHVLCKTSVEIKCFSPAVDLIVGRTQPRQFSVRATHADQRVAECFADDRACRSYEVERSASGARYV